MRALVTRRMRRVFRRRMRQRRGRTCLEFRGFGLGRSIGGVREAVGVNRYRPCSVGGWPLPRGFRGGHRRCLCMFPLRRRGCRPSFRLASRSRRFRRFRALVVGQVSQTGLRTVTGMLVGARQSGVWHHARAHRFFACARRSADRVGLTLASMICERLPESGEPVVVAVDDSLFGRVGAKVHACSRHRDVSGHRGRMVARWGNSWVVAGIVLRLPFLDRPVCLPVPFRLWRPKRKQFGKKAERPRASGQAGAGAGNDRPALRTPARPYAACAGDSAYAGRSWRGPEDRVTIIFRLRRQAAPYTPAPPTSGRRGRPRSWVRSWDRSRSSRPIRIARGGARPCTPMSGPRP